MKLTGENRSTRGKPCPSATLSTTNLTRTDPVSNPGLRDERPATNRLSYCTACIPPCFITWVSVRYVRNIILTKDSSLLRL
jgi:hypothetical protein